MTTILRIDASPRRERSLTRRLADRFIETWLTARPGDRVIARDVGLEPPPAVSEAWIAAAFTPEAERDGAQRALLALSDTLIDELAAADVILMAAPMHNYGMPAALKAWIDQIVRIDRTFTFDLDRGDWPLEPVMGDKTLVLLTASGEFGFAPGGVREGWNHLDPHIRTVAHYLGVSDTHHLAIEYQEFRDDRHEASVKAAHDAVPGLVDRLTRRDMTNLRAGE
ncbi:MAG: FMN-dependent NADH-azoreductase [Pikeienuella sp.]|uniref:FMN-dependent NADH-azoreductase n=1 Tax=Pikeienuella sp. TaxID=2831957 RepID=UPI00391B624E